METNINIWEEKSYTEQSKNYENKKEFETLDITKNTETKSEKELSNIILETGKKWKRNCLKCGREQCYATLGGRTRAEKRKQVCRSCGSTKIDKNQKYTRNCPKCNRLLSYSLKGNWKFAIEHNRICKFCAKKLNPNKPWKVYVTEDFHRNCPKCNKIIIHKSKAHRNYARKGNKLCKSCSLSSKLKPLEQKVRICPRCSKKIRYKFAYLVKLLDGKLCRSCNSININVNPIGCKFIGQLHLG